MNTPHPSLVYRNRVYMRRPPSDHLRVGCCIFACGAYPTLPEDSVALNAVQRHSAHVKLGQTVPLTPVLLDPRAGSAASFTVKVSGATPIASKRVQAVDAVALEQHFLEAFDGQHLVPGQQVLVLLPPANDKLTVCVQEGCGAVGPSTELEVQSDVLRVTGAPPALRFNFRELGIGGLDAQSELLFRRAFASRMLPEGKLADLGVRHVRGVLLHGPPGTGKTLIARRLSEHLTGIEPKVVNGPDILNKFVGESERNVRALFEEAEQAQRLRRPGLHVLIFDEMDAICKTRGTATASGGVGDSIVNQLLTKIDGVQALDNILVIGLTNRIDLLDRALLRPGRLEVQIEVTLPGAAGRRDILDIHTRRMQDSGLLCRSFDAEAMVGRTRNFTGAELEALVKGAASHAMARFEGEGAHAWRVTHADFVAALQDVQPMFGTPNIASLADTEYDSVDAFPDRGAAEWLQAALVGKHRRLLLTCADGLSLALLSAADRAAPYTRLLRGCEVGALAPGARVNALVAVFEDARKSHDSLVVLDDIELLVGYCPCGPQFCSTTVQALKAVLQRPPADVTQLHVVCTTPRAAVLERLGLTEAFDGCR